MGITQRLTRMFNFKTVRDSIKSLDERLASIGADIEATQRKRDLIANAPTSRADMRALVERWVDTMATGWAGDIAATLRPLVIRPTAPSARTRVDLLSLVEPANPYAQGPVSSVDVNRMLCAVFRDEVVAALHAAIDGAQDWPAEGLPASERPDATAGLDAKLAELSAEQEALRNQAAELGLNRF